MYVLQNEKTISIYFSRIYSKENCNELIISNEFFFVYWYKIDKFYVSLQLKSCNCRNNV